MPPGQDAQQQGQRATPLTIREGEREALEKREARERGEEREGAEKVREDGREGGRGGGKVSWA